MRQRGQPEGEECGDDARPLDPTQSWARRPAVMFRWASRVEFEGRRQMGEAKPCTVKRGLWEKRGALRIKCYPNWSRLTRPQGQHQSLPTPNSAGPKRYS